MNQELQLVPMNQDRLMRTKADMASKTLDAMLIEPLLAFAGPLLKAMGMGNPVSIYQALLSLNDEHMRSFLSCVTAITLAAQDDQVSVDSFGEGLVERAEQIKYIFAASKEQSVYPGDTGRSEAVVSRKNRKR